MEPDPMARMNLLFVRWGNGEAKPPTSCIEVGMQASHDERTLAALAHASIVTNGTGMIGLVAAAAIWVTQRDRSAFVRAHALQALVYQGIILIVTLVMALSWGMCVALALLPLAIRPDLYPDGTLPGPFWLALSGLIVPVLLGLLGMIYGLVGAYQAYNGRTFTYPFLGRLGQPEPAQSATTPPAAPLPEAIVQAIDAVPTPTPVVDAAPEASPPLAPEPAPAPQPTDDPEQPEPAPARTKTRKQG